MSIGSGSLEVCPLSHTFWHPNISLSTFVQSSPFICISFGSFFFLYSRHLFFSSNLCYFQFQDNWFILWQLVQLIPPPSSFFHLSFSTISTWTHLFKERIHFSVRVSKKINGVWSILYLSPHEELVLDFINPKGSMTGIWIHCAYVRTTLFWNCSLHHPEVFVVAG